MGCMCLPSERDLIKPHGRDAAQVPVKKVGEVFKASPALRPRPVQEAATSSLATIAEVDQPIVIDDDDVGGTGTSTSSAAVSKETPAQLQTKRRPMLKSAPVTRPKVLLKSPPVALTKVPPPVERYAVPKGPMVPLTSRTLQWSWGDCRHQLHLRQLQPWHQRHHLFFLRRYLRSLSQKRHQPLQLRSQGSRPDIRCRLRLMPSCGKSKRREQRGQSNNNNNSMMICCPLSSSPSSKTQSLTAQWGFIPREKRIAWDVIYLRSLISDHCPWQSRIIS